MTDVATIEISDVPHRNHDTVTSPTTPKPNNMSTSQELPSSQISSATSESQQFPKLEEPSTPTTQGVAHASQSTPTRHSGTEDKWDSMDVDGSDPEDDGSDNDTENGEQDTSTRKKKGQRFFCTGYPPCNLSFTRSEHLARHIRKHTGERPFQCHCNRRFSRLDNLRQHAQTVHVNEEIPTDSLAATGTRFQRQIRTDRVRPTGRPRTNTIGSTGSHGRGHGRNLSSSSIGSTSSNFSTSTEPRRRPPPLLMANDGTGRPKLGIEPPRTPPAQYRGFGNQSPGGLSTPTSTTYSATPGSPMYGSSIGSPMSNASRTSGFFGSRTPTRRLSVPSGVNPFQPHYGNPYATQHTNQMVPASNMSTSSSVFTSPTSAFSPGQSHHVSPSEDWRRRTWHPSTYSSANFNYGRPATSGLMYSQTPDAPQPAFAPNATAALGQAPRLPGIESFDHVQHRPSTPPRRQPSPMQLDAPPPGPSYTMPGGPDRVRSPLPGSRAGHVSWDVRSSTYPAPEEHVHHGSEQSSWGQQTLREMHNISTRHESPLRPINMGPPLTISHSPQVQQPQQIAQEALNLQAVTPRSSKRQGWYIPAPAATRTSPEDSSSSEGISTPRTSAVDVNPAIVHSNGYIEPHHHALSAEAQATTCIPPPNSAPGYAPRVENVTQPVAYGDQRNGSNEMTGLEALVAVATSKEKATASVR